MFPLPKETLVLFFLFFMYQFFLKTNIVQCVLRPSLTFIIQFEVHILVVKSDSGLISFFSQEVIFNIKSKSLQ